MTDTAVAKAEKKGRDKYQEEFNKYYYIIFSQDPHSSWDFKQTALTQSRIEYVGEIKDIDRPYGKYNTKAEDKGFLIDFDKLRRLVKIARNENRIPLLVCFFSDCTVIWDLTKTNWEARGKWKAVNKEGLNYGEKEDEYITYLYIGEAVYVSE